MTFKCLGVDINCNKDKLRKAKQQSTNALRVGGRIRDVAWPNKYLNVGDKVKVYKTTVPNSNLWYRN